MFMRAMQRRGRTFASGQAARDNAVSNLDSVPGVLLFRPSPACCLPPAARSFTPPTGYSPQCSCVQCSAEAGLSPADKLRGTMPYSRYQQPRPMSPQPCARRIFRTQRFQTPPPRRCALPQCRILPHIMSVSNTFGRGALYRDPFLSQHFQHQTGRVDGSLQTGSITAVEVEPFFPQDMASLGGFPAPGLRQLHIRTAGEPAMRSQDFPNTALPNAPSPPVCPPAVQDSAPHNVRFQYVRSRRALPGSVPVPALPAPDRPCGWLASDRKYNSSRSRTLLSTGHGQSGRLPRARSPTAPHPYSR